MPDLFERLSNTLESKVGRMSSGLGVTLNFDGTVTEYKWHALVPLLLDKWDESQALAAEYQ